MRARAHGQIHRQHRALPCFAAGRYQVKRFRKALCPIVERLCNALMRKGRNNGKKLLAGASRARARMRLQSKGATVLSVIALAAASPLPPRTLPLFQQCALSSRRLRSYTC